ncbi:(2Fe-2S)-binding protein [Candidatus Gracilibacteria bacterium]|nr:(2Fe-2S)-binding protein [Candidatus Gracilibacteria bacterium]
MPKVKITDKSGKKITEFEANADDSIGTQAQANGCPIPMPCMAGACGGCIAKIKKGQEYLDPEALGPTHIPIAEDEVLACMCGIKKGTSADSEIEIEIDNL